MGAVVNFQITISDVDLRFIGELLEQQPYRRVVRLIDDIQQQINAQQALMTQQREAEAQEAIQRAGPKGEMSDALHN